MEFKDYYQLLGVERGAAQADIKKAYRRLVRKHHPDVNSAPDAQVRMQELNEAWEVLQDPEKRAAYDRLGQGPRPGQGFQPPPDWDAGFEFGGGADDAEDLAAHSAFFESLFGGARRGAGRRPAGGGRSQDMPRHGQDHHAKIVVPLDDVFHGATRTITLQRPELDGQGRMVLAQHQLSVSIPTGLRAGQQIRLAGQGAPSLGSGPPGDLYLEVQFEPHARYQVDGRDLYLTLRVAPWEAALGASVPVLTPGGEIELTVPPHSKGGRKLRLKGRGIPAASATGAAGDLYVVLELVLPPARTAQAQESYQRMAKDLAFDPRAEQEANP
jgi:curved DNA-binding protein